MWPSQYNTDKKIKTEDASMANQKQIPELAAQIVKYQSYLGELTTADADWVKANTPAAIKLFSEAIAQRDRGRDGFGLRGYNTIFTRSIDIPIPASFSAIHSFCPGKREGVKIWKISPSFQKLFLRGKNVTTPQIRREPESCRVFSGNEMLQNIPELLRRDTYPSSLSVPAIWGLLKLSSADGSGYLQMTGHPNVIVTSDFKHEGSLNPYLLVILVWNPLKGWSIDADTHHEPRQLNGLIDYYVGS